MPNLERNKTGALMNSESKNDQAWMRIALVEARKGLGTTNPNPAVGAVIVKDGRLLARGYHRRAGRPHAAIEELPRLPAGQNAPGATHYVTLEPCSTSGRPTPLSPPLY